MRSYTHQVCKGTRFLLAMILKTRNIKIIVLAILAATFVSLSVLLILSFWLFPLGAHVRFFWSTCCLAGDRAFRKGPMLHLIGDQRIAIVWESCRLYADVQVIWNGTLVKNAAEPDGISIHAMDGGRFIYQLVLSGQTLEDELSYRIQLQRDQDQYPNEKYRVNFPSARKNDTSIRFAIIGDNQTGYATFSMLLKRISEENPDFLVHVGDMVQTSIKDYDWQTYFFTPLQSTHIISQIPLIIAQGNHDMYGGVRSPYFVDLDQLSGQPVGYYYATSVGPIRWIVLDSNRESPEQVHWLEGELASLASRNASFRIVVVHAPPFIEYWDPKAWQAGEWSWTLYLTTNMVPLFEKYHVDLVLSGHQHNYQRGLYNGVHYVITGGGGGMLDRNQVEEFNIYNKTIIEHHYLLLDIDPKKIHLKMETIDGRIADEYIINKRTQ